MYFYPRFPQLGMTNVGAGRLQWHVLWLVVQLREAGRYADTANLCKASMCFFGRA